ncbi:SDR family oxidoreductase [Alteromonas sp. P256]|uniref:SDR family oxidoreductase n=1 Tax=Alteromonas sp. P256 TaxID=3117399 RepID=UPI002FDF1195
MTNSNDQQTAIITGGSRGIGKAIALKLAEQGNNVIVNYQSNALEAEAVVKQVQAMGVKAKAVQADISERKSVDDLFNVAKAEFGGVDIVVNNAAVQIHKMINEHTAQDLDSIFDINAKGAFYVLQNAVQHLNEGGHIVALSSSLTTMMVPGYSAYNATKAAVEQYVRSAAKEVAQRGININAVAPGPVDTELLRNTETEQGLKFLAGLSGFQRLGTPQDIANIVGFFCSDDSRWVSGQVIRANGALI